MRYTQSSLSYFYSAYFLLFYITDMVLGVEDILKLLPLQWFIPDWTTAIHYTSAFRKPTGLAP